MPAFHVLAVGLCTVLVTGGWGEMIADRALAVAELDGAPPVEEPLEEAAPAEEEPVEPEGEPSTVAQADSAFTQFKENRFVKNSPLAQERNLASLKCIAIAVAMARDAIKAVEASQTIEKVCPKGEECFEEQLLRVLQPVTRILSEGNTAMSGACRTMKAMTQQGSCLTGVAQEGVAKSKEAWLAGTNTVDGLETSTHLASGIVEAKRHCNVDNVTSAVVESVWRTTQSTSLEDLANAYEPLMTMASWFKDVYEFYVARYLAIKHQVKLQSVQWCELLGNFFDSSSEFIGGVVESAAHGEGGLHGAKACTVGAMKILAGLSEVGIWVCTVKACVTNVPDIRMLLVQSMQDLLPTEKAEYDDDKTTLRARGEMVTNMRRKWEMLLAARTYDQSLKFFLPLIKEFNAARFSLNKVLVETSNKGKRGNKYPGSDPIKWAMARFRRLRYYLEVMDLLPAVSGKEKMKNILESWKFVEPLVWEIPGKMGNVGKMGMPKIDKDSAYYNVRKAWALKSWYARLAEKAGCKDECMLAIDQLFDDIANFRGLVTGKGKKEDLETLIRESVLPLYEGILYNNDEQAVVAKLKDGSLKTEMAAALEQQKPFGRELRVVAKEWLDEVSSILVSFFWMPKTLALDVACKAEGKRLIDETAFESLQSEVTEESKKPIPSMPEMFEKMMRVADMLEEKFYDLTAGSKPFNKAVKQVIDNAMKGRKDLQSMMVTARDFGYSDNGFGEDHEDSATFDAWRDVKERSHNGEPANDDSVRVIFDMIRNAVRILFFSQERLVGVVDPVRRGTVMEMTRKIRRMAQNVRAEIEKDPEEGSKNEPVMQAIEQWEKESGAAEANSDNWKSLVKANNNFMKSIKTAGSTVSSDIRETLNKIVADGLTFGGTRAS